jgi:phosphohistidine phosphatase
LLVGHNPTLQQLILDLSKPDERGLRSIVEDSLPTAALATIELRVESWAEVEPGKGQVVELILPKEL